MSLSEPLLNYLSPTLGDEIFSGMFGNLLMSFMRQVVIIKAYNIPKIILK